MAKWHYVQSVGSVENYSGTNTVLIPAIFGGGSPESQISPEKHPKHTKNKMHQIYPQICDSPRTQSLEFTPDKQ